MSTCRDDLAMGDSASLKDRYAGCAIPQSKLQLLLNVVYKYGTIHSSIAITVFERGKGHYKVNRRRKKQIPNRTKRHAELCAAFRAVIREEGCAEKIAAMQKQNAEMNCRNGTQDQRRM